MENDGGRAEKRGKKGRQNGSRQPFKTSNRLGLGGGLSHVTGPSTSLGPHRQSNLIATRRSNGSFGRLGGSPKSILWSILALLRISPGSLTVSGGSLGPTVCSLVNG